MIEPIKEVLSYVERSVFGKCPVCSALPEQPCDVTKFPAQIGSLAHFERLSKAPKYRIITYHE